VARLLILTLSTGEAALPVLRRQLATQSFQDFEHEVISGLPNLAAHSRLYRTVMDRAGDFDLFLKLDADMTLRADTSIEDVLRATETRPDGQHFVFRVWDCFTEEETLGVHVFRSGVRWGEISDSLFVDPDPPGVRQVMWDGPPAPFVNHGEVVSDFECFSFGVHKFLKVAQRGRSSGPARKAHKFFRHMRNCARIRDLYRQTRADRHRLALTGMIWAMDHPEWSALPSKSTLEEVFESEVRDRDTRRTRRVDRIAGNVLAWRFALVKSLGVARAFAS
jgi:hypothetical protein